MSTPNRSTTPGGNGGLMIACDVVVFGGGTVEVGGGNVTVVGVGKVKVVRGGTVGKGDVVDVGGIVGAGGIVDGGGKVGVGGNVKVGGGNVKVGGGGIVGVGGIVKVGGGGGSVTVTCLTASLGTVPLAGSAEARSNPVSNTSTANTKAKPCSGDSLSLERMTPSVAPSRRQSDQIAIPEPTVHPTRHRR